MKVLVTSDLHGKLAGLDPKCADLVLVAGDFSRMSGWELAHMGMQLYWVEGWSTIVRNVSRLDEEYQICYEPFVLEL